MPKSSYEEQIADAVRKSTRPYRSPADRFVSVMAALGVCDLSPAQIDAEWRAFYTTQTEIDDARTDRVADRPSV